MTDTIEIEGAVVSYNYCKDLNRVIIRVPIDSIDHMEVGGFLGVGGFLSRARVKVSKKLKVVLAYNGRQSRRYLQTLKRLEEYDENYYYSTYDVVRKRGLRDILGL